MSEDPLVAELRELIVRAAPDPAQAAPVASCPVDQALDEVMPFSSLILLGVVVALEDRFGIHVSRDALARAAGGGLSLLRLAELVRRHGEAPGAARDARREGR